ncbi:hypothetical protein BKK56_03975 [Rodentibacter genomosp. 2]|uniref:minor capsid protein n=1 Tax=Rodentibacter genomosp. 2 TaxID=1908266 RepID=UPI0009843D8C|nr:hypothetical protein BKK56_03975 [Rodentibacter genomosp. 2]
MKVNSIKKQTLDEKIAYALTDRKILHFRYDAHLRQAVWKRLNQTQKALLNRISAAGIEALPKQELDKLLRELKGEIINTYQELTAYTDTELSGFFMTETTALQKLYNESVGFDFFNQVPDYKLKATQRASLIAGAPLEDWWKKQGNDMAFRFETLIRQGLLDGKQTHELVGDVKELMGTSRRHAETLVITAVAKTADEAHQALRDENLDLIKGEKHLATLDMRTSEVCRVRDGLMWDVEKKPIDHDIPYKRPPLHPRCRSILQLVMKSWKELGFDNVDEIPESTRASMDGQVSENINYENWLKGKSQAEQDAVLGKGKADLWRRGVITFRDMLDQSGRPLTLTQLNVVSSSNRWKDHIKKINDIPLTYSEKAQGVMNIFKEKGVEYNPVQLLKEPISRDEIIQKISGGDETEGSCASLALSYIGNRIGLDVTDYRGGVSCDTFSRGINLMKVLGLDGVIFKHFYVPVESKGAVQVLKNELLENDKEYFFVVGKHAAIVRKNGDKYEYLELQDNKNNGWFKITDKVLRDRFGANTKHSTFAGMKTNSSILLAEVDSFKNAKNDFRSILGYLNTAIDKQQKGDRGWTK